ncbi:GYF domain-containing protein [Gimesia chilikensis]|uniref:GYF domain-containing protein n=1 Tax=Gimesia chilikensis TaxID=2605989 RepID=UPI003A9198DD
MASLYVTSGTETEGPLTRQALKELASQGKISPRDQIREGMSGTGIQAREIPGLLPTLKQSRVPSRSRGRKSRERVHDLDLESSPLLTIEQKEWIVIICGSIFMGSLLLIPLIQAFVNLF